MAKRVWLIFVPVVLIVLQVRSPSPARGAADEADLSSPAKALAAFSKALENGESGALTAASFGDAKMQDWVQTEAAQLRALKDLETALAKSYGASYAGDTGKEIKEEIATARDDDLHADLGRAHLKETQPGETLIILNEAAPADHQGRLLRVDGRWKVDLASLSDYMAPDDVPVMKAVAAAATALARDISEGKLATIDDAAAAVDARLTAAAEPVKKQQPAPPVPRRKLPPPLPSSK